MHLEAVPHAQRHRPAINAPQVAPEALAVAEAVGHSPLTLGGHHSPQRAPPWLAILFGTRKAPPSGRLRSLLVGRPHPKRRMVRWDGDGVERSAAPHLTRF